MLRLSETSLGIAGGIILFLIAVRMIFPTSEPLFGRPAGKRTAPFSPGRADHCGAVGAGHVLLLASHEPERFWTILAAVAVAMGLSTLILMASEAIARLVGRRVLTALERLMGLILTAVAVEMFLQGIRAFVLSLR